MVKALINNHLSVLTEAKSKGVTLGRFNQIKPTLRGELKKINKPMDVRGWTWNRILGSPALINFVNTHEIEDSLLDDLMLSEANMSELEDCVTFPFLTELYNVVKEIHSLRVEEEKKRYYYSSTLPLSTFFSDMVLYFLKYGYDKEKIEPLFDTIRNIKNSYFMKDDYKGLGNERIDFLNLVTLNYPAYIDENLIVHYKDSKGDFEFYEALYSRLGSEEFKRVFKPLKSLLKRAKDKEQVKQSVLSLLENYETNVLFKWFKEWIPTSEEYVTETELKRLLTNAPDATLEDDVYSIIYGKDTLYYQALVACKDTCYTPLRKLVKQSIANKKKAFIRLVINHVDEFKGLGPSNILYDPLFQKLINLNTLNAKNIKDIAEMNCVEKLKTFREDVSLTFQEFHFLYDKDSLTKEVFYNLMDLSIDERLRVCRQFPDLEKVQVLYGDKEEFINRITQLVRVKPLKRWIEEKKIKLENAKDEHYLMILLAPEKFEKFRGQLQRGIDVEFVLNHPELLAYANTLDEAKAMFILEDEDTQYMLNKIGASKEFVENNISRIVSFSERNLTKVFKRMHERGNLSHEQAHNLNLITKAELAGKLEEIKFVEEDFELEIGLPIENKTKLEWKQNREKKIGKFIVQEAYDYETIIRIGENPVKTCMNWNTGGYSHCLLSNFDTNKKVLVARDMKGNVVSRAILRLTKGSDTDISMVKPEKKLAFKDVEAAEIDETKEVDPAKEELVLFLERRYTSLDPSQATLIDKEFVNLAKEKAKALGAKLVVSSYYKEEATEGLEGRNYYIFISYSKNGQQYLDSLSGQATESNAGEYHSAYVLMEKTN